MSPQNRVGYTVNFQNACLVIATALLLSLSACDKSTCYNESSSLEGTIWKESDTLMASFEVSDSQHYHNIFVLARFNSLYPYSNIYFKVMLSGPKGIDMTEIKSFDITDKSGKWLGNGFGDLHSYELPIFPDLALKQFGKYKVKVVPHMRKESLEGIHDHGIKVSLGKEIF